jgi:hypothetical protein
MLGDVTRVEVDALRLRCEAALEGYRRRAARVLQLSKWGELPAVAELEAEEAALYEFAKLRRDLLDALSAVYRSNKQPGP